MWSETAKLETRNPKPDCSGETTMRTLIASVLMLALLSACGAADSTQSSTTPATEASTPATAQAPASDPVAERSSQAAEAVEPSPAAAEASTAGASSTIDIGEARDAAASAVAAASAANAAAGPSDDGCPSGMTPAHPENASLTATWNPEGTITVRGGLDVPADSTMLMFTYQDGTEVGWAQFGSFGIIEAGPAFEQTSTIPPADDIIYGEMARQNPYQPGSLVCVALMAIRGDASVEDLTDPAKQDELLLTRVRLPVVGDAPAEIVLP
jgi:hypothetical protein